jgi:hypothetical protein
MPASGRSSFDLPIALSIARHSTFAAGGKRQRGCRRQDQQGTDHWRFSLRRWWRSTPRRVPALDRWKGLGRPSVAQTGRAGWTDDAGAARVCGSNSRAQSIALTKIPSGTDPYQSVLWRCPSSVVNTCRQCVRALPAEIVTISSAAACPKPSTRHRLALGSWPFWRRSPMSASAPEALPVGHIAGRCATHSGQAHWQPLLVLPCQRTAYRMHRPRRARAAGAERAAPVAGRRATRNGRRHWVGPQPSQR